MLQDIVLGIVQGLTEFLPISSSGHLIIVPRMVGWDEPELALTVLLHLGTLIALLIYFRSEIIGLINGVLGRGPDPAQARRITGFLLVGSIPAAVAGLAFSGFFDDTFHRPYETCIELVVTGFLLLAMEHVGNQAARHNLDHPRALGIGTAQALAILPGISRSGATIGAGLWFGMSREEATRFSFLLSIPAIVGALVLDLGEGDLDFGASQIAGVVASGIAGYLSIAVLLRYVRTHSLRPFAWYLFAVAPVAALVIAIRG